MVLAALLVVKERLNLLLVTDSGPFATPLERRLLAEDLERRPELFVLAVSRIAPCSVHVKGERLILLEGAVFQLGAPRVSPGEEFVKVGSVNLEWFGYGQRYQNLFRHILSSEGCTINEVFVSTSKRIFDPIFESKWNMRKPYNLALRGPLEFGKVFVDLRPKFLVFTNLPSFLIAKLVL